MLILCICYEFVVSIWGGALEYNALPVPMLSQVYVLEAFCCTGAALCCTGAVLCCTGAVLCHFGCPDCPNDPPKVHLEAQSAPACCLGPSKVLLSQQRGIKITKSDFSDIFDQKVGPETLKCLQSGLQTGYFFRLLGHFSYIRSPSSSKVTSKS